MNKKFSTLMAGLMLASAFSVNALGASNTPTAVEKYVDGKYFMLGNSISKKVLTVVSKTDGTYGELKMTDINPSSGDWSLQDTRNALWQVKVTTALIGDAPKYSFVNVATGMILSVPTPEKNGETIGKDETNPTKTNPLMIAGGYMEWFNGTNPSFGSSNNYSPQIFMSYVNKNDVVYLMEENGDLYVKRGTVSQMEKESSGIIKIQPYKANVVSLNANELNKELIMNNDDVEKPTFTLSFNKDVTDNAATNLFAATPLKAIQMYKYTNASGDIKESESNDDKSLTGNGYTNNGFSEYVRLYSENNGYIVVDTALHVGSEAKKQLPKFAYDNPYKDVVEGNNVARMPESFNFKFAYDPYENRVLIKAEKYAMKLFNVNNNKPVKVKGSDGNTAYTYWPTGKYWTDSQDMTKDEGNDGTSVSDAYIRLVELSGVRELTVAAGVPTAETGSNAKPWSKPDDAEFGMLTKVTIGKKAMDYEPTTIESGLYMIQYKGTNDGIKATDNYFIANLGGAFGYAEQAKNQNFDHMPAAQWYVEKQGTIETAPITIRNREFFDGEDYVSGEGTNNYKDNIGKNVAMQAFKGENGEVFFMSDAFKGDTLKFIPVSAASKADSLLGYKHVDEKQASVETYYLNYLHGLALDKGLNTPVATDSLVRVDENGDKIAFRLIPVIEHDSYGIQLDAKETGVANLLRNAYYVEAYDNLKFVEDGESRYLRYDEASKKYIMSKTPKAYFLKENNCIDGTHYYALVEANVLRRTLINLYNIVEAPQTPATSENFNAADKLNYYAPEFAGKSVKEAGVKTYGKIWEEIKANDTDAASEYLKNTNFYPLDKNGQPVITDASDVLLYAYQNVDGIVTLKLISKSEKGVAKYAHLNGKDGDIQFQNKVKVGEKAEEVNYTTKSYASARVSVDDNTLDLTQAMLQDKWIAEIRVSAFETEVNDSPLYRRFNGVAPETYGDAANAPLNLKFYRHNNDAEYLFENYASENKYRDGIVDNSISFLGVNNAFQFAESETRSYTMYVDTAYVRNNTRMPQYLIAVKPEVVEGDTILCDASTHQHKTPEEALACEHTQIKVGFTRAMYLFNAQDSIDNGNYDYQGKAAYGAAGYTRLAFKDAVHAQDTLYILNPGVTTEQLKEANFKNDDLFAKKIALDNNKHKNVVFQFRLIDSDNNRFLIESEAEQNGSAVLNKDLQNVCVAPMRGGWVKIQNGVPVIARFQDFNEAIRQAEVFDVNDEIKYDAVDNEEIAVEGVSVVAGNGQVTIMGAAGKNVTITNILGKVIASQVIASDNATIAVPAGIVAVAVEGEAAVKAIVK